MNLDLQKERILVLVKALPHPSDAHVETVCCAGVTVDHVWKRLYPVRFRLLEDDKKFTRWQWIEYRWRRAKGDPRLESQRVDEASITPLNEIPRRERAEFLRPLVRHSLPDPVATQTTLVLIRPDSPKFSYRLKNEDDVRREQQEYAASVRQTSLLDSEIPAFEPCPYDFRFRWRDDFGNSHDHSCGDWEVAAMFRNFSRRYGEEKALVEMDRIFNQVYPENGMAFSFGTHSRRASQWLLVGVLRLDETYQTSLF